MLPDFQSVMLPLLESLKEGEERTIKHLHDTLASYFELTNEELNNHLPGNDQTIFYQQVAEAKRHLLMADLLSHTSQDMVKITPIGMQVLHRRLNTIDTNYLRNLPGYKEATGPAKNKT